MEELNDFSSSVIEFKSTLKAYKSAKLTDCFSETYSVISKRDASTETNGQCSVTSQTDATTDRAVEIDETVFSNSLKSLYPRIELELLKGVTPLLDFVSTAFDDLHKDEILIRPYQIITIRNLINQTQGLACWLAVHTNNAPGLILTTSGPHDGWCDHVDQSLKLFIPKRAQLDHFVAYVEEKSLTLKSCMRSLCTNPFNKNMFAGSTLDGGIYIWIYSTKGAVNNVEMVELCSNNCEHGCAVAMDWMTENRLLTCHANGWVMQWCCGSEMLLEESFFIESNGRTSSGLSSLVSINPSVFVVGTDDGRVCHCSIEKLTTKKSSILVADLTPHHFMVSTLLKRIIGGCMIVISADISGQVYYHNLKDADKGVANVILQIPLPFRNSIACSQDGNLIYSPGNDGSLDCFRIETGAYFNTKGALRERGNFIKCSDNGLWIIISSHEGEFQIFTTN